MSALGVRLIVNFLRSKLFVALISLSLLVGFGHETFGDCHRLNGQDQMLQSEGSSPLDGEDCECVCHQFTPAQAIVPLQLGDASFCELSFTNTDECALDGVPQGIDHPPRLS